MCQSCWRVGKGFWSSPGSGYNGRGGGGVGRAFLCASCGLFGVRGIFKRFEGEQHSLLDLKQFLVLSFYEWMAGMNGLSVSSYEEFLD